MHSICRRPASLDFSHGAVVTTYTYGALGRRATVFSGTAKRLLGSFSYTVDNHDRLTLVGSRNCLEPLRGSAEPAAEARPL